MTTASPALLKRNSTPLSIEKCKKNTGILLYNETPLLHFRCSKWFCYHQNGKYHDVPFVGIFQKRIRRLLVLVRLLKNRQ
jgi:hypothetical protein